MSPLEGQADLVLGGLCPVDGCRGWLTEWNRRLHERDSSIRDPRSWMQQYEWDDYRTWSCSKGHEFRGEL